MKRGCTGIRTWRMCTSSSRRGLRVRWPVCCVLRPLDAGTPFLHSAVSQEQVDEVLIRHPQFGRHLFEVVDCRGVEADGHLTLELLGVGILTGLGEIVFFSH